MVLVVTYTKMDISIKDNLRMAYMMEKGTTSIEMEKLFKEILKMVKNQENAQYFIMMVVDLLGISRMM